MPRDFDTLAVHAGIEPDPATGAVMTPIYQTSTFAQIRPGEPGGYEYSRTDNPTRTVLQNQLAALEGGSRALVFASGMAAIDAVLNLLPSGSHVVAGDDLYGGTRRLFTRVASARGLRFTFCALRDEAELRAAVEPATRLIWFETPTNPMLGVVDIGMVARVGRQLGILTALDNTFMSPYFQRPLALGIDLSMHSMTKFLNGHSDVVMGALIVGEGATPVRLEIPEGMGLAERLKFLQNSIGAVPGPFDCWLVLRGLKTLGLRMARIGESAQRLAEWLQSHPAVEGVRYPGLPGHPGHELTRRQASGFGGVISFTVRGGEPEAKAALERLELFAIAESLGGVESLAEIPATMTHASVPPDVRKELGIADNLIRLSIGIESFRDLQADLDQALRSILP